MYCKYCGKEIAEDSAYCQYCGGQLQGDIHEKTKHPLPLLKRFQSMSKGWQVAIMVYIVWLFAGICVLIGMAPYGSRGDYDFSEVFWPVFLAVIGVPIIVLFVWYYFARLRMPKKKIEKINDGAVGSGQTTSESVDQRNAIGQSVQKESVARLPLLDFAQQHGKMQVKTVANPTTNEVRSFCVFTNEQGIEIEVHFSQELGPLRPQEIAERKEQLVVVQKMDGTFELE